MSMTVSEFVWHRLAEWGTKRVFGYPGDGVGGLDVALEKAQGKDGIEYVQVRHEEMAAFMASAHAKFTGEVGVCYATSGPGATHLITGLYDAKMDHVPVVAIVGQQARTAIGAHYQQEVDLQTALKDVASEFIATAMVPSQIRHLVDRAVRIAAATRCVTCVIIPNDLQLLEYEDPPLAHGTTHTGVGFPAMAKVAGRGWPAPGRRRAECRQEGGHAGGRRRARARRRRWRRWRDRLQAGCAKALLGKAVLPDDLPWVTGGLGLLGTAPSWNLMQDCDTLLMVGSSFPYSEFLPKPGTARAVQIDVDPTRLSLRYPMEVNLMGDSAATLRALLPMLEQKDAKGWRDDIAKDVAKWWKTLEDRAMIPAKPINPQRIFWECSKRLPENTIMTGDSGSVANWYGRDIKMRRGMMGSLSGSLASLGAATPYAVAAKFAHPERVVLGFIGDGAMQMNGLNVMITVSKYWRRWSNPKFIIMVLNNQDLNQVTWEERVQLGTGKTESTQAIPDFPYHSYAELLGLKGIVVRDPELLGAAWDEAFNADRPVIMNVYADANVPPLPPHITFKDAKNFVTMMASEPELGSVVKNSVMQVLASVLPHKD